MLFTAYSNEINAEKVISEFVRDVELNVRVQALPKQSISLHNELDDALIQWVIPDGASVKKGDVLIRFFTEEILDDIMDKKQDLLRAKLSSNTSLLQLEGVVQDKKDELDAIIGDIEVLEAQRDKLRSYPLKEDVLLGERRLEVAEEKYKAAQAEFERETNRFNQKMISEKQWRKSRKELAIEKEAVKNAEILLEFDKLSSTERSLRVIDLKIENKKLLKQELEWNIEIQKKIIALKKKNVSKRVEISESQLERVEKEYAHREIIATEDGLVSYMPRLIRSIQEGTNISRGIGLFNIVDPNSLEFKGTLRSKDVNLFREGDPATLIFNNGSEDLRLKAKIKKINRNPTDVAGESTQWADQNKSSGIKVYEVIIESEEVSKQIYPGTYGHAILKTKEPFKGPAIPLKDLQWKNGQARLALGGVYKKIHGKAIQDMFFLEDSQLLGRSYEKELPKKDPSVIRQTPKKKVNNRIQLNAEMEPYSSESINVPRLRHTRSLKMDWVIEDGKTVKEGDLIFKMGSEDLRKRLEKLEKDIQRTEEEVATMEKEHQNMMREKELKRRQSDNELEIAQLEFDIVRYSGPPISFYNTRTQLYQKKIEREFAEWSQKWSEDKAQVIGEVERRKLKRDLQQLLLEEERLKLQLEDLLRKDEIRLSSANLNLIKEEFDYHSSIRSLQIQEKNSKNRLVEKQKKLERDHRSHEALKAEEALFTIKSPKEGTIKFLKVWDGLRMSAVAPGYQIYSRMSLAEIYDISDMMIKLQINESLYKKINDKLKVTVFVPSVTEDALDAEIMNVGSVFKSKERPDLQSESLYGSHERLGEQVFFVNVKVKSPEGLVIKPGTIATVNLEWSSGELN